MIDLEVSNEIKGRFSIEDVASDNEEELENILPESFRELQRNRMFDSFDKTKLHLSKKKQFIYKELTSPKEFLCEVFDESSKNYQDFNNIWNSLKVNINIDESYYLDLLFNVNKEKDFIKITDFFETHSDFKDNLLIQNEFNENTKKEETKRESNLNLEKINDKNKDYVITDRITALNSTLDSCLNVRRFCSIGTQTDATFEPEFKLSLKSDLPEKINKLSYKKKNRKSNRKKSVNNDTKSQESPKKRGMQFDLNIEVDNHNIFRLKDIDEMSPIIRNNPEIIYKNFYNTSAKTKFDKEINSIDLGNSGFTIYQTPSIEIPPIKFHLENVSNFTILNTKLRLCEDCSIKFIQIYT
jgi:hypothetical protein